MSKNDDIHRVSTKDEDPVRKLCVRFNRDKKQLQNQTTDFKDAVAYLQLRRHGCPRKEAIIFAAKNNCRVDSTRGFDGPKDFRSLKVQSVPKFMVSEGWLYGQQDFNFGCCYPSRYSEPVKDKQNIEKLEENFDEQEIKMRKEYKDMIDRMKEYVKQINQKYNFSNQKGQKLLDMVKKIVKGMKNELDNRLYFVLNGVRYYDAAEAIMKKRMLNEEQKNNLIEKMNVFQNYENEEDFQQVQISKYNDDDQTTNEQKNIQNTGILNNINGSQGQIKKNKYAQEFIINNNKPSISMTSLPKTNYASQLKSLECATKLLEEFERAEGEELSNGPNNRFDRSYINQKKLRQEQMQNNLNMVRQENSQRLEGQFNQQKYFYNSQEKKNKNQQREYEQKEGFQNQIFDIYKINDEDEYQKYKVNVQNSNSQQREKNSTNIQEKKNKSLLIDDNLIDMSIIQQMNIKQQKFIEHFRNKIQTTATPFRDRKQISSTPNVKRERNLLSNDRNNNKQQMNQSQIGLDNKRDMNNSHHSTVQTSHLDTLNLFSNYQSNSNMGSLKNSFNNRNKNNTPVKATPTKIIQSQQSNISSRFLSQFSMSNSSHNIINAQNQLKKDTVHNQTLSSKLINRNSSQRDQLISNKRNRHLNINNNPEIQPQNKSLQLMTKNQSQLMLNSSKNIVEIKRNQVESTRQSFNSQNFEQKNMPEINEIHRISNTQQNKQNIQLAKKLSYENCDSPSKASQTNIDDQESGREKTDIGEQNLSLQITPKSKFHYDDSPK